jgi:hypothetical protein
MNFKISNLMKNFLIVLLILVIAVPQLAAQQAPAKSMSASLGLYVFPAEGQTKEVQDADEMACYNWAKEQSGIDPINPPDVQVEAVDTSPDGTAVRSAARGAAAGAAIGAIAGDAGKGAAIGAAAGGMGGIRAKRVGDAQQQQQNTQAAASQEKAMMDSFKKAFTACMEGKGYTVK